MDQHIKFMFTCSLWNKSVECAMKANLNVSFVSIRVSPLLSITSNLSSELPVQSVYNFIIFAFKILSQPQSKFKILLFTEGTTHRRGSISPREQGIQGQGMGGGSGKVESINGENVKRDGFHAEEGVHGQRRGTICNRFGDKLGRQVLKPW